jgi:tetratricopeptide (TPR) repeat protein/cellulose biosynthesis protein BcsQ
MICTFYSYKGGVGRSMALANVADVMARRGFKVLVVDFDLEAPGLERYFDVNQESIQRQPGLLDLVLAYKDAMSSEAEGDRSFRNLEKFICPLYQTMSGGGKLDVMSAGHRHGAEQLARYALELRTLDWQDFYYNWQGERFFEWVRRSLLKAYDLVLIDSRTGVTEMGGICGYQLPDVIVMMCAANYQNVEGTQNMLQDFRSPNVEQLRRGRPLEIVVVPARIEQRDGALIETFFERFDSAFAGVIPQKLAQRGMTFRDLMVPYEPEFAFEERVVSDPNRYVERKRIGSAFSVIADVVTLLAPPDGALGRSVPQPTRVASLDVTLEGVGATATAKVAETQFDVTRRFAGFDVFVDSGEADRETVEPLVKLLQKSGLQIFHDSKDAVPNAEWETLVTDALLHSRTVLCCVGEGRLTTWRLKTVHAARRRAGVKFAVALLPGSDPAQLDPLLRSAQSFDLRGPLGTSSATDQLVRFVRSTPAPETAQVLPDPYPGARPFGEEHADVYFGRKEQVDQLAALVREHSFVWLLGPAGCGKTSLLKAGLLPLLRRQADNPCRIEIISPSELSDRLQELKGKATAATGSENELWLVDGLEEAPAPLQNELLALSRRLQANAQVRVLASMRSDAFAALERQNSANPQASGAKPASSNRLVLPSMTSKQLLEALKKPADAVGVAFEPGLAERIVADVQSDTGALVLVQRLLSELWKARREGWLTNAAYDALGGFQGLCARQAEAAYLALDERGEKMFESVFLRLVDPSGWRVTRRRLSLNAARPAAAERLATFEATVTRLENAGLLRIRESGGEAELELAHEALIGWDRLRGWIAENHAALVFRVEFDLAYQTWVERKKSGEELLRGALLNKAVSYLHEHDVELVESQRSFIRQSKDARKRFLWLVAGICSAVLLVVGSIVSAGLNAEAQRAKEEANRVQAEKDRALAQKMLAEGRRVAALEEAARSFAEQGRLDQALSTYGDALRIQPDNAQVLVERAALFAQQGETPKAEQDYSNAITAAKKGKLGGAADLADVYLKRGALRLSADRVDQALADYQEAQKAADSSDAWLAIAAVYDKKAETGADDSLKQQNSKNAVDAYSQALSKSANLSEAYFKRGVAYERLGDVKSALSDYNEVLKRTTDPLLRSASQTRAATLGATLGQAVPVPSANVARVYFHYANDQDRSIAKDVMGTLDKQRFLVKPPLPSGGVALSGGQVQYFFGEDENIATEVKSTIEQELARRGVVVRMKLVPLNATKDAEVSIRPGYLEVWLPPLSSPLMGPVAPDVPTKTTPTTTNQGLPVPKTPYPGGPNQLPY